MNDFAKMLILHVLIGGFAASVLVVVGLVQVAMSGDGSRVSPARRLPQDSDGRVFGILFSIGAVIGLAFALISQFDANLGWLCPTGVLGFTAGAIYGFNAVRKMNEQYLVRAQQHFDRGEYREAIEDASEVARSSEKLRGMANQIVSEAREIRNQQPLSAEFPSLSA